MLIENRVNNIPNAPSDGTTDANSGSMGVEILKNSMRNVKVPADSNRVESNRSNIKSRNNKQRISKFRNNSKNSGPNLNVPGASGI